MSFIFDKRHIMKQKTVFLAIWCVVCFLPVFAAAAPVAVIEEPVYTFESVVEGEHVEHEFVVKNSGDEPLKIINVSPP